MRHYRDDTIIIHLTPPMINRWPMSSALSVADARSSKDAHYSDNSDFGVCYQPYADYQGPGLGGFATNGSLGSASRYSSPVRSKES